MLKQMKKNHKRPGLKKKRSWMILPMLRKNLVKMKRNKKTQNQWKSKHPQQHVGIRELKKQHLEEFREIIENNLSLETLMIEFKPK